MTAGMKASIKKMTGSAPEPWHAVIMRPLRVNWNAGGGIVGMATTHGWFETHGEAVQFVRGRLDHPSAAVSPRLVDV